MNSSTYIIKYVRTLSSKYVHYQVRTLSSTYITKYVHCQVRTLSRYYNVRTYNVHREPWLVPNCVRIFMLGGQISYSFCKFMVINITINVFCDNGFYDQGLMYMLFVMFVHDLSISFMRYIKFVCLVILRNVVSTVVHFVLFP